VDINVLEKPTAYIYREEHSSALKVETTAALIPVHHTFQKTVI
jgi:hypothetical protein